MKKIYYIIFLLILFEPAFSQSVESDLFKTAKMSFDDGEYREAISQFTEFLKTDSTDEEAWYYLGRAYLNADLFDSAIQNLTYAIKSVTTLAPSKSDYYLYRALAYKSDKIYYLAASDFESAIKLNPSDPRIYFEDARLKFIMNQDKSGAIDELGTAIKLDPDYAPYYVKRAEYKLYSARFVFDSHDMLESAVHDISFAISLDPSNYEYYKMRSEIYKESGEPLLAIGDYNEMIRLEPEKIKAYTERGLIRMQNDDYKVAIKDFTSAISHDPTDEKNFRFRGLCKYNSSDYTGAYKDFTSAIGLLTKDEKKSKDRETLTRVLADTYIKRGVSAYSMGNSFNACIDFRKAYDLGASKALNYYNKYCGY